MDTQIRTWDTRACSLLAGPLAQPDRVEALAVSPDGSEVTTAGRDGHLRRWNARTGEPQGEPVVLDKGVGELRFHADGRLLLATGRQVALLEPASGRILIGPRSVRRLLAWGPDAGTLLVRPSGATGSLVVFTTGFGAMVERSSR